MLLSAFNFAGVLGVVVRNISISSSRAGGTGAACFSRKRMASAWSSPQT